MSRDEVKSLIKKIMAAYPNYKPADLTQTVDMWASMLKDIPFSVADKRLDAHIATSAYVPTIADILQQKKKNEFHNFNERTYDYDELLRDITR